MPYLDENVEKVIERYINYYNIEEPFYVANIQDIIDKHINWLTKMPRVKPYYAVKCNSTSIVLEVLAGLGLGFDCASKVRIKFIISI